MKDKSKLKNLSEIALYAVLIIMGVIVMAHPAFGLINPIYYVGSLFYIFAFFNVIAYFIYRKESDYELLFGALISIITASFMFITSSENVPFILGTVLLIYTLLTVVNKGYSIYKQTIDYIWVIKFIVTFLISFLGLLTIINLYNELSVQTLMIGYYFISLGVMSIIEPLIFFFVSPKKLSSIIKNVFKEEDNKKEENNKKTKEVKTEKPKNKEKTIEKKPTQAKTTTKKVTKTQNQKQTTKVVAKPATKKPNQKPTPKKTTKPNTKPATKKTETKKVVEKPRAKKSAAKKPATKPKTSAKK